MSSEISVQRCSRNTEFENEDVSVDAKIAIAIMGIVTIMEMDEVEDNIITAEDVRILKKTSAKLYLRDERCSICRGKRSRQHF